MIVVNLKSPAGDPVCDITLPENPAELPLARYVSFMAEVAKIPLPGTNVVFVMAKAVAEFSGQPLDVILTAKFGDEWKQNNSAIEGIRALYGWCVEAIGKYKGQPRTEADHRFKIGKQDYEIPLILMKAVGGRMLPDIETGEAVEALEIIRTFGNSIATSSSVRVCVAGIQTTEGEEQEKYIKRLWELVPELKSTDLKNATDDGMRQILADHGDEEGSLEFSRYLYMMAILCRKPGEKLPWKHAERKDFIARRAAEFQGIDTQTALDVDFFLHSILNALKRNQPIAGSLILPAIEAVVETRKLNDRRTRRLLSTKKPSLKGLVGGRLLHR